MITLSKLGRVMIGAVFAYMGLFKIISWQNTTVWMTMKGFPEPIIPILLAIAILVELGGGLALVFGLKTRLVALGMALFMIPTNIIMHNFWALPPEMAASEQLSFLQNVIIIGGLLLCATTKTQLEVNNKVA